MADHMGIEKTKSIILERAIWYNLMLCVIGKRMGVGQLGENNSCFMLDMH